jgi:thioredoxin reductase
MRNCDVAIVGAGPYGLSIAAHLKASGVDFRIFGKPMGFWRDHMPDGMHLKSEGFASSLSDPSGEFKLGAFCKERGLEYADLGSPVPLGVFTSYGLEFQKRFVPELEDEMVVQLEQAQAAFKITLQGGEVLLARRVVVAVGQTYFPNLPRELTGFPKATVTHSSEHSGLDKFTGKEIAIVGAGSSALDLAALLHEHGASVQVVARIPKIRYHDPLNTNKVSLLEKVRNPTTGIGVGWKLWLCARLPLVFRLMPEKFRLEKVRRLLGPVACWFIRDRVEGKVGFHLGVSVKAATVKDGRVNLELIDSAGLKKNLEADHVIAATGFDPSLKRITFLAPSLVSEIACTGKTPALSSNFESTVRGLYFVGVTAANTFGPMLRFAYGAEFTAPRLSRHLARTARQKSKVHNVATSSTSVNSERVEPLA